MSEHRGGSVDITNCDREPIHIPGAIQPHGVLFALQPDLIVVQASENASVLFGRDLAHIVGSDLSSVLPADATAAVRQASAHEHLADVNPVPISIDGRAFDGVLHRSHGLLVLEIEPRRPTEAGDRTHHPLRHAVASLQAAQTLEALLQQAAQAVHHLTGFERVMTYSFDEDDHGKVAAEVKADGLDSYLGLHYPASDIPRQARALYLRNPIRSIPDARYVPATLIPSLRPDTGTPLDLSFAGLRSVSPIHLEYLANMGIRASMSISLVVRDRLWGLISCANHSGPHYVPYAVRSDCELVGRVMSLLIAAFEDRAIAASRAQRRPILDVLVPALRSGDDALAALVERPHELFALLRLGGAAIVSADVRTAGDVPPLGTLRALAGWVDAAGGSGVFVTDSLPQAAPEFAGVNDVASGVVSFALPGLTPRRFLGFRPEILHTVDWGGDPRKPVEEDAVRLHPRRSFALWREEVRLRSQRWSASDRDAAEELRRVVVEIDLEQQVARERRAVRARDDLVAVVSHDLKNPLNVIQMQSVLLRNVAGGDIGEPASRVRAALDRIQRAAGHMDALIHDLLDLARIEAGRFVVQRQPQALPDMVEEALILLRPLAEAKGLVLREEVEVTAAVSVDRERIFQVLSNLVGNAIKFTPAGGTVTLRAGTEDQQVVVTVTDTGPGLAPDQVSEVFNRYWQASKGGRDGAGLGLYIAKGIIEAHGGRIWAEQAAGSGAVFKFTLPWSEAMPPVWRGPW